MSIIEWTVGIIGSLVVALFSALFKRHHDRMVRLEDRVSKAMSEDQIRTIIQDKLAPIRVQNTDLQRRMGRIEEKLDRLLDRGK